MPRKIRPSDARKHRERASSPRYLYTFTMFLMIGALQWGYQQWLKHALKDPESDPSFILSHGGALVALSFALPLTYLLIKVYDVFPAIDLSKSYRENKLPSLFRYWQPVIKDVQTSTSRTEGFLVSFVSYIQTIVTYSMMYGFLSQRDADCFNQSLGGFDAFYFSVVTMATVGFGDISPRCQIAKTVVILQIFTGLLYAIVVFSIAMDSTKKS
ncbi:MAG TPA: ion channel [Pirellulales bacterium]|nr:ion channel [Pirellulales bacterium]